MGIIVHRTPIDTAFYFWINNSPESYHRLDMRRFYQLVKTVKQYSRKPKSRVWIKEKIEKSGRGKGLSENDIEYYCDLFEKLLDYDSSFSLPVYSLSDRPNSVEVRCKNGEIKETPYVS